MHLPTRRSVGLLALKVGKFVFDICCMLAVVCIALFTMTNAPLRLLDHIIHFCAHQFVDKLETKFGFRCDSAHMDGHGLPRSLLNRKNDSMTLRRRLIQYTFFSIPGDPLRFPKESEGIKNTPDICTAPCFDSSFQVLQFSGLAIKHRCSKDERHFSDSRCYSSI
jgi:hypothetical protein